MPLTDDEPGTQYRVWAHVHTDESNKDKPRHIWQAASKPFARYADAHVWADQLNMAYRIESEDTD